MRKFNGLNLLAMILMSGSLFLATSCNDDDPVIGGGDQGNTYLVAPGLYLANVTGDTLISNAMILNDGLTDGGDIGAGATRQGYKNGFIYLESGSYVFAEVGDEQTITSVIGGDLSSVDSANTAAGGYSLIGLDPSGNSFSVASSGVYHVAYDESLAIAVLVPVNSWGILGSALENGFRQDEDLVLEGTASEEGVIWKGQDIVIREGEFKIRYNDNWTIRIEDLLIFTNFGGEVSNLIEGASNITWNEEGTYTVTIQLSAIGQLSLDIERTDDAPEVGFDPVNYALGVIGTGAPQAWSTDYDLFYAGYNDEKGHRWYGMVPLTAGNEIKIRANDEWAFNLGGSIEVGAESTLVAGGDNMSTPENDGVYYFEIYTTDEGETWKGSLAAGTWGILGNATSTMWASDTDFSYMGTSDTGVVSYSITTNLDSEGEFKVRANDAWDHNLGGDVAALTQGGDNLSVAETGTYEVVLSFDAITYSMVLTKQ